MVGVLVGFACVIGLYFKPQLAKFLGAGLRPRRGLLPRRHLEGLRDVLGRHRRPGRRRHDRRVRRDARALPHADHQGHRALPPHRHRRHARHHGVLPRVVRDQLVRRAESSASSPARACSASAFSVVRVPGWPRSTWRSTSTSSSGARRGPVEGLRVVRRLRPARHHRVAVPRDAATAGQAPRPVTAAPGGRRGAAPHRRSRGDGRRRGVARRARGWSLVGLGVPPASSAAPTAPSAGGAARTTGGRRSASLGVRARLDVGARHHGGRAASPTSSRVAAAVAGSTSAS